MLIDRLRGDVRDFAEACIRWNSIEELQEYGDLEGDCEEWCITADEWHQAIDAATEWLEKNDG